MTELYPLLFTPVFKERVWGGRRLDRWFSDLPAGPVGEAWILSDHPEGPTPIANGPFTGASLSDLIGQYGPDLLGGRGAAGPAGSGPAGGSGRAGLGRPDASGPTARFPLLFKLLDATADLSVQVHPPDGYAGLPPGELGKSEMWVVLDAAPQSQAVYGLQPGTDRARLAGALAGPDPAAVFATVPVRPGDVLYVPAGTVHALGAGMLVAEIQQSSDTVYRLYDYNRAGLDGRPRPLHIADGLAVTDYGSPPDPVRPQSPAPHTWSEICRSPFFVVEMGLGRGNWAQSHRSDSFTVLMSLAGALTVRWPLGEVEIPPGRTVLIPAAVREYALSGNFQALRTYAP